MEKQLRVEIISKGERKVTNYESENFVLGFVVGAIPTAIVGSIILLVLSL